MNMYEGWGRVLFTLMVFGAWALALYLPIVMLGRDPASWVFKPYLLWAIMTTTFGFQVLKAVWLPE